MITAPTTPPSGMSIDVTYPPARAVQSLLDEMAKLSKYDPAGPPSADEGWYVKMATLLFNHFVLVPPCNRATFIFDLPQMETAVKRKGGYFSRQGLNTVLDMFKLAEEKGLSEIEQALAVGAYLQEMNASAVRKYKVCYNTNRLD